MRRIVYMVIAIMVLAACERAPEMGTYKKSAEVMYTTVTITVVADGPDVADRAIDAAFAEIARLEGLLSFWTETSEIAALNREAGRGPVRLSDETYEIVARAMEISRETDGAFDGTIGPVIREWDFKTQTLPDPEALARAIKRVDYRRIRMDSAARTAYLESAEMSFDTGGIAKGYAADRAVGALKANGIRAGIVAVAGDVRVFGTRQNGSRWRVGIRDPRGEPEDLIASIDLGGAGSDEAISTSGDYERYFVRDGVRYHHLLDPRTGMPAEGSMSVTVVAPKAVLTDGYATGVFVLGPEKGIALLERLGLGGVIITADGRRLVTRNLESRVDWIDRAGE